MRDSLKRLDADIAGCQLCPRLRQHCAAVAAAKRRAYREWEYWGKPVPGFGDPQARLFIVGLAPAAHGANRTGRVFTGDASGDFLYRVLHRTGFASQPASRHRDDGLTLLDARIAAAVRCAPPANKPTPEEFLACRRFLERELALLTNLKVVVALGRLAFDSYCKVAGLRKLSFAHNLQHETNPVVITSYHPSQQNTFTGRLTEPMLEAVFRRARRVIEAAVQ